MSRWDAGQYIGLGLRGYEHCPPRGSSGYSGVACNLAFYPTFGWLGRLAGFGGRVPIDYALFGIALLSGFVFLFLFTDAAVVSQLGLGATYLALLLFNVFTTGYCLVTPLTEPLTLALTMGAFIALARGRLGIGALLGGATSGLRITGVATSVACAAFLLLELWQRSPVPTSERLRRFGLVVLSGWGGLGLMAYHGVRFGNPFAYLNAHAASFHHPPSILNVFAPDPVWIVRSLEHPLHEGLWLLLALVWFLLGHRESLRRFSPPAQAFWYALFIVTVALATVGQLPIALAGMNRYLLLALPLFFAMAAMMKPRPLLLVLWLGFSGWHYWNVDLCEYTGGPGNNTLKVCHAPHWVGHI